MIVIVSRVDGRIRGGMRHKAGATVYEAGALSVQQLHEIAADPMLSVVKGVLITHENLTELLAEGAGVKSKGK